MKQIAIYQDGSAAVIDTEDAVHAIRINGQEPIETLPATEENLTRYFGNIEKAIK